MTTKVELKRCTRCLMPETWQGIIFDNEGICNICREHEVKKNINWGERQDQLKSILYKYKEYARNHGNKYDCILPSSGGKDSTWALYTAKVTYNMTPLVVTWNHGLWMSEEARYNLYDIPANLDCDHIDFRIGKKLRNDIARKASIIGGDFCAFCHLGVGALPARIAKQWDIPLVIYGEPTAEYQTTGDYKLSNLEEQDKKHFELCFQGQFKPEVILPADYELRDMLPMAWPEGNFKLKAIYLGNFLEWEQWKQVDIITKELYWKHIQTPITFTGWDKVDCERGECLRELQKFYRRGVSRIAFQCSKDIRDGLMTREKGMELVKEYESKIMDIDLDDVISELGFKNKQEFLEITNTKI